LIFNGLRIFFSLVDRNPDLNMKKGCPYMKIEQFSPKTLIKINQFLRLTAAASNHIF